MASAMLHGAASRLERWLERDKPEPRSRTALTHVEVHEVVSRAAVSQGPAWATHASAHVDHWCARALSDPGELSARDVRRLRTAVRRLREIVCCVAPAAIGGADIDRALRRIAKRLGTVRDADVTLALLATRRSACGSDLERAALDELDQRIVRGRARALPRAAKRLDPGALAAAVSDAAQLIANAIASADPHVLALAWWTSNRATWLGALRLEHTHDERDLEALHTIRIAARRIRYGVELFDAVLPAEARAWQGDAIVLQRALGQHRDAALFHEQLAGAVARAARRGHVALGRGLESSVIAARAGRLAADSPARAAITRARARARQHVGS